MGEWISVKDRLPESAGWYLVFYNGSNMQVAFFKGKKWPFDNHYHKITHWMPLPEPPMEKPKKRIKDHVCNNDYCELE